MPTIRFQVFTDLPPDRVLQALIDFSDQRPIVWPKIGSAGSASRTIALRPKRYL